ncbi:MAG: hypothetical protein WBG92_20155 [Thiohalocapsa sp.]
MPGDALIELELELELELGRGPQSGTGCTTLSPVMKATTLAMSRA